MFNGVRRMECDKVPDEEWQRQRFNGKCYFYPGRDCPGFTRGELCARIKRRIPTEIEERREYSED